MTSGAYTVTVRDAGGRATQLNGGEVVNITDNSATTTTSDVQITAAEAPNGTATFAPHRRVAAGLSRPDDAKPAS